jgi:hypothetical protein
MAFWEDTLRYLYLPRLKSRDSLTQAIRTGAASSDFFGTAYGQDGDKYTGFHVGEGNVQFDDTLLLIEPSAAIEYQASLKKAEESAKAGSTETTGGTSTGGATTGGTYGTGTTGGETGTGTTAGTGTTGTGTTTPSKPKTFHGSIQIKPSAAKMHLVQVAEEIISLLASDPNASVNITLEIDADFPSGASDQIKRAVTENATSLGFKTKTWE